MNDDVRERVVLLPCPFCGKELSISKSGMATHSDQSQDDCIIGTMGIPTDHPASVEKWNARAIDPAPVSVREAARVLLDHIAKRYRIAEYIHQNTDASSVGAVDLALMHALRAIAEGKDDE